MFSLLGTAGTQALSEAFAAEPSAGQAEDDSQAEIQLDDEEEPGNEPGNAPEAPVELDDEGGVQAKTSREDEPAPETEDRSEALPAEAGADPEAENLIEAFSQAEAAPQSFRVPDERYVFEYVYGVISNDHALFSSEPFDPYDDGVGVLVSRATGQMLGDGMLAGSHHASGVLEGGASVIPFQKNGKCGLWSLTEGRALVDARYDTAGSSGNGSKWGFILQGEKAADGTYPQAKAVIVNGATEVLAVPLEGYKGWGDVYYVPDAKEPYWEIYGGVSSLRYIETSKGFQQIPSSEGDDFAEATYDGRGVSFVSTNTGLSFRVRDKNGVWSDLIALPTDAEDTYQCSVVSNIIEVEDSNGHDYQYFDLSGKVLQSFDGMRLEGVGNYVAYERIEFETQQNAYVFLDTSGANSDEREIPCLRGKVVDGVFECLAQNGKIQRYDADLKVVKEFAPSMDLAQELQNGEEVYWGITDFGNDVWMLSQTVGYGGEGGRATDFYRGTTSVTAQSLGLESAYISCAGVIDGTIYLMDNGSSCRLRLFDKNLAPTKTVDLSSRVKPGFTVTSLKVYSSSADDPCIELLLYLESDSSYESEQLILNKAFELTDLSHVGGKFGDLYIAVKDGKYGLVDANLRPKVDFVYDRMDNWVGGFGECNALSGYLVVEQDGKQYLIGSDLKDTLGFSFSAISALGKGAFLVVENGKSHVFDGNFNEVSLLGYRPIEPESTYGSARILSNGDVMVYVKDAQGRVGAIDSTGKVLIPFQYKDYAECADADGVSDYILLRDDKGWFFVSVQEIQGGTVNPECEAKGHDYEEAVHAPTCEENGYTQKVCKRCGYGYRVDGTDVPKLGHDYVLTAEATEPTCTEDGKGATYTCTRCKKVNQEDGKPNLGGHVNFDWRTVEKATCAASGLLERSCDRCGLVEQEKTEPLGHVWGEPTWEWADDFSSAVAHSICYRGCGETLEVDAEMSHDPVEGGTRHSARVSIGGRSYKDGRLPLTWVDANGVTRSLLVRGAPVVDGFNVKPDGLVLPVDATVTIDVAEVREGGVFDALVAKMGSGWPGGTFDVRLNVDDEEVHDNFGTLAFSFPAGDGSANKRATIYHCHKNDRANITSHDVVVSDDGIAFLAGIVDLSTFAIEVSDGDDPLATALSTTPLAATGDGLATVLGMACAVFVASLAAACVVYRRRKVRG